MGEEVRQRRRRRIAERVRSFQFQVGSLLKTRHPPSIGAEPVPSDGDVVIQAAPPCGACPSISPPQVQGLSPDSQGGGAAESPFKACPHRSSCRLRKLRAAMPRCYETIGNQLILRTISLHKACPPAPPPHSDRLEPRRACPQRCRRCRPTPPVEPVPGTTPSTSNACPHRAEPGATSPTEPVPLLPRLDQARTIQTCPQASHTSGAKPVPFRHAPHPVHSLSLAPHLQLPPKACPYGAPGDWGSFERPGQGVTK